MVIIIIWLFKFCKEVYQRKHKYETIWYDQSISSSKGIKYKRESNYYDLINSNEIRLYKIGIRNCEMQCIWYVKMQSITMWY